MKQESTLCLSIAREWKNFALLDCGDQLKVERWNNIYLVRPDSQILWPKTIVDPWQKAHAVYDKDYSNQGQWQLKKKISDSWEISYKDLTFKLKLTPFKHTGLFPEQAYHWDLLGKIIKKNARVYTPKIINLFGYTGAASIAIAKSGAFVTHVDASKNVVKWCLENAQLSKINQDSIRYIVDDVFKFVEREKRRNKVYDGVVMDPPSFGRGKKGEVWKIEKHLWQLLIKCKSILSKNPLFFLINAYKTGLSPTVLHNLLNKTMHHYNGFIRSGEIGLPIESNNTVLPCGIFARWQRNPQ